MTSQKEDKQITQEIAEKVFDELLPKFQTHEIYTKDEIFKILNDFVLEHHLKKIGVI